MKIFSGVAAVLSLSASSLLAGTVAYNHVTPTQSAPFTDNFTLPQFDAPVGDTLTGITISLSYTTTGEINIINISTSALPFTNAKTSTPLALTAPGSLSITTNAVAGPIDGTANPFPPPNMFSLTGSGMQSLVVPMVDWSLFEGIGLSSFTLAGDAPTTGFTGDTQSLFSNGTSSAGGSTTITYTFASTSDVPEPATMTLISSALLGIGFFARKRINKA